MTLAVDHVYGADLEVVLISPTGTRSLLAKPHSCPSNSPPPCGDLSKGWTFHSVRHMGESLQTSAQSIVAGQSMGWQLQVRDGQTGDTGQWRSWRLVMNGH